jgi:putative addiction module killer protein
MYEFIEADEFSRCMKRIKTRTARDAINERIAYARLGHLGKLLKGAGGVSELVVDMGPGYRLYYCRSADRIYWLLLAGAKKD